MENCIIKRFKGTVDSDLLKYGEFRVVVSATSAYTFDVTALNNVMEVSSGSRTSIVEQGNNVQLPWIFSEGSGEDGKVTFSIDQDYEENDFRFVDKKNIKYITIADTNISNIYIQDINELAAIKSLVDITLIRVTTNDPNGVKLSLFKDMPSIKKLSFTNTIIYGNLSELPATCSSISCNYTLEGKNTNFTGNIETDFGNRIMTYLGVRGSACTGDIATFADAQVSIGRVSGKVVVRTSGSDCTNSYNNKLDGVIKFTSDTTTYPRGWYWED